MPPNHKTWKAAEDDFEAFVNRTYGKDAFLCWLSDTAVAKGLKGKSALALPQPADATLTVRGEMCYLDVKTCSNPTSFPFADIRPSQWAASVRQVAAGGEYYFFIKNMVNLVWYQIPAQVFHKIRAAGIKSAKWDDLQSYRSKTLL